MKTRVRRRFFVRTAALLVALSVSGAGCSSSPASRSVSAARQHAVPSKSAGSPAPLARRDSTAPYPVAVRTVTVIDRAAGTPARGPSPARADRVLTTWVWYPAARPGGAAARPGRYPLVVFAHGFDSAPRIYSRLLRHVAAAGYVVAAPRFPISASGLPGAPREDDMLNQALDVRATTTTMLGLSATRSWLAGRLDRHEIAVLGHSDGAETVIANVLVPGYEDRRIKAAVILAGQLPIAGGLAPLPIPTLVVQGSADPINPPSNSRDLYARLDGPKWYLNLIGATHASAVLGAGTQAKVLRRIVVAFLDASLRGVRTARTRLEKLGNEPGITRLTSDSP